MRWNIGRLASSRGRAWWLFERVEYIRESVGCAGIFYCTDRRDSSLIIDAEKRTQVGLDAAGKTTILYKLKLGEIVTTIPTIGTFFARRVKAPPSPPSSSSSSSSGCAILRVFLTRVHSFREEQRGDTFVFLPTDVLLKAFLSQNKKKEEEAREYFLSNNNKTLSSSSSSLLKTS